MTTNHRNRVISLTEKADETGVPRVDLNQLDVDVLVQQKSYSVIYEKAIICPCKTSVTSEAVPSCKNCGGQGWIFINPTKANFAIQSVSIQKKMALDNTIFDGTFNITTRANDGIILGYMDKITMLDCYAEHSEFIETNKVTIDSVDKNVAFITYIPDEILHVFKFNDSDSPLISVSLDDITVDDKSKYLFFKNSGRYSIRYRHQVQLNIISINRDIRYSKAILRGEEINVRYPQSAIGRRLHQSFDAIPYIGDGLYDNSDNG